MSESNPEIKMTENSINEFYKLKSKYESDIIKNKKKIINNTSLSLNEKRREFNKLVPNPFPLYFSYMLNLKTNIEFNILNGTFNLLSKISDVLKLISKDTSKLAINKDPIFSVS